MWWCFLRTFNLLQYRFGQIQPVLKERETNVKDNFPVFNQKLMQIAYSLSCNIHESKTKVVFLLDGHLLANIIQEVASFVIGLSNFGIEKKRIHSIRKQIEKKTVRISEDEKRHNVFLWARFFCRNKKTNWNWILMRAISRMRIRLSPFLQALLSSTQPKDMCSMNAGSSDVRA